MSDDGRYNLTGAGGQLRFIWVLNVGAPQAVVSLVKANTSFVPTYRQGDKSGARNLDKCSKPLPTSDVVSTISKQTLIDRGSQFYQDIKAQFTDAQGVDRTVPDG
ncbi:unnamed protein product [Tilletia controversa]|nr:unnamed protein product [Tilletia controversa]